METLQKNRLVFSCCESNNIFSHIEMDTNLTHVKRTMKWFAKTLNFPEMCYVNLSSINSDSTVKRKKRVNVIDKNISTTNRTKNNKIKQMVVCAILLVGVNLIVILCS